jgi:hypothetical protein
MHDAARMRIGQRIGDFSEPPSHFVDWQRPG